MRRVVLLLAWAVLVGRADDFEAKVKAAMADSLAKQEAAVAAQQERLGTTWTWTEPVAGGASGITTGTAKADCPALPAAQQERLLTAAAVREGLEPSLLRAVIHRESAFRPCAVSAKGAQGLMQLMPATAAEMGVRDPFDPEENVGAGSRYLKQLLKRYNGSLRLALAAYNAGAGRVDAAGGLPAITETQDYVAAILGALKPATAPGTPPRI